MRLSDRIVCITGASRGFGAAVARACAAEGAHLVLTGRTKGGLEEVDDAVRAAGGQATLIPLDLRQGQMIDTLGAALYERFGRLDGLVLNAGELGPITPVSHLEPKVLERVMGLNVLATHRLIRSLEPLLKASADGRAVVVTDAPAREPRAYWGAYAASKAALEALARCWALELRITPVRVNLAEPGPMGTRLRGDAFPGEKPGDQPEPAHYAAGIVDLLDPACTRNGELVRLHDSPA
ncbi:SDR family NAD(P)-dependent oxidoreductase [Marinimicrococcus flavescens]|uniref:SDR family NAD(P)-dependent oxidoreductase n=1 Tax=Marinimicrococcus flavescens TaxID=3031815 RepID=A0AAP4D6Z0_9PROT|nr:SDR family NAD(P)-dependent oxidoreductase [Marinimicrococcus flavescens]